MKIENGRKTMVLAAAQMVCADGDVRGNLDRAALFARQAAAAGADLLVFPEFMPQGFRLTEELWDTGEPFGGTVERWLADTAREHGLYIGTSFLQEDGGEFYNCFSLASPTGRIEGRVYKQFPSLWEAFFFTGRQGPHHIDTALGRIGIGICFDNHTWAVAEQIANADVDLMLMPHSYFVPDVTSRIFSQQDMERSNNLPGNMANLYNRMLGVPVLMVNKAGKWDSPVPTNLFPVAKSNRFSGRSLILDADGSDCAQLDDSEGLALATVMLDEDKKRSERPKHYGRYLYPGSIGREYIAYVEWIGKRSYRRSALRKSKATNV